MYFVAKRSIWDSIIAIRRQGYWKREYYSQQSVMLLVHQRTVLDRHVHKDPEAARGVREFEITAEVCVPKYATETYKISQLSGKQSRSCETVHSFCIRYDFDIVFKLIRVLAVQLAVILAGSAKSTGGLLAFTDANHANFSRHVFATVLRGLSQNVRTVISSPCVEHFSFLKFQTKFYHSVPLKFYESLPPSSRIYD